MPNNPYTLIVRWSDEDQAFLVFSPEWGERPIAHGDTREEAIKSAEIMLELMIETLQDQGQPIPRPQKYVA